MRKPWFQITLATLVLLYALLDGHWVVFSTYGNEYKGLLELGADRTWLGNETLGRIFWLSQRLFLVGMVEVTILLFLGLQLRIGYRPRWLAWAGPRHRHS